MQLNHPSTYNVTFKTNQTIRFTYCIIKTCFEVTDFTYLRVIEVFVSYLSINDIILFNNMSTVAVCLLCINFVLVLVSTTDEDLQTLLQRIESNERKMARLEVEVSDLRLWKSILRQQ